MKQYIGGKSMYVPKNVGHSLLIFTLLSFHCRGIWSIKFNARGRDGVMAPCQSARSSSEVLAASLVSTLTPGGVSKISTSRQIPRQCFLGSWLYWSNYVLSSIRVNSCPVPNWITIVTVSCVTSPHSYMIILYGCLANSSCVKCPESTDVSSNM